LPRPTTKGNFVPTLKRSKANSFEDEDDDDHDEEESSETDTSASGSFRVRVPLDRLQKILGNKEQEMNVASKAPIHVGGTPGTGKTAFGLYLLHKLLELYPDNAFIYRHGDVNPGCFLYHKKLSYYHPSIAQAFSDGLLLKSLTYGFKRPIWTILDGAAAIPTGTLNTRMIVLTSPGQQTIPLKHLLKHATSIVNPPWNWKEINLVRKAVYPHLPKEEVARHFRQWGGIPRILLDYGNKIEKIRELEDGLYSPDPFLLFRQAGLSRIDHANVSGIHFHLIPGERVGNIKTSCTEAKFRYGAYCWASTWLQERFWEILRNELGEISILNFLLDRNNFASARALAFEPHVFRTIENSGIGGELRLLNDEGVVDQGSLEIDALTRPTFSRFSELPTQEGAHSGRFYVPIQTNHMSLDAYIPDEGIMMQITIGQKHGVKAKGLEDALNSGIFDQWRTANPEEKIRLVFLCDHYNFPEFRKQNYLTQNGTNVKSLTLLQTLNKTFTQYSWELNVETQLQQHLRPTGKRNIKVAVGKSKGKAGDNKEKEAAGKGKGVEASTVQDVKLSRQTRSSTVAGKRSRSK
jgi:hypothetical protein